MKHRVIEFVGVPGCGKSTITKHVVDKLKCLYKDDIIVRSDISVHINIMWKQRWTIPFFFIYHTIISKAGLKTKYNLLRFICQYSINSFSIIYATYILLFIDAVKKAQNHNMIILLDEGIIQFLTSIPHEYTIIEGNVTDRILNSINELLNASCIIKCTIRDEIAINRIRTRGKVDRFQYNENLKKLLAVKGSNITYILSRISCRIININMEETIEHNTEVVINEILQK